MSIPSVAASALERIRRPEYTGENRCLPCTVLNLAIALAVAAALWLTATALLGLAVLALAVAAIALRGYLVPGTPWLTATFLPDRVLAVFETHGHATARQGLTAGSPPTADEAVGERPDDAESETYLLARGVIAENDGGLTLDPDFGGTLDRELETLRAASTHTSEGAVSVDASDGGDREHATEPDGHAVPLAPATVAPVLDAEPAALSYDERAVPAVALDGRIYTWPSGAALLGDVATDRALRERTDDWTDRSVDERLRLLSPLRLFHEDCPACGGPLDRTEQEAHTCCRSGDGNIVEIRCANCEDVLLARSEDTKDWMPFGRV